MAELLSPLIPPETPGSPPRVRRKGLGIPSSAAFPPATPTPVDRVPFTPSSFEAVPRWEVDPRQSLGAVWQKTLRKMIRSALYAALARLLFGFLKSIVKGGLSKKMLRLVKGELLSANPWKWAVLVGSLSSYRGVQQTIERLLPAAPVPATSWVAGALTSLGFFVMNMETRTELALYTLIRAVHGLVTAKVYPKFPQPLQDFNHWDTLTMCVTAVQIMYCLVYETTVHQHSYQSFLVKCTTVDPRVLSAIAGLQRGLMVPELVDYARQHSHPVLPVSNLKQSCTLLHNGSSCLQANVNFIVCHFTRFCLPLYVPLKLSTTFGFGFTKAMKNPLGSLTKAITSALQSSVFLTAYCIPPYACLCVFPNLGLQSPALMGLFCGVAGLATLIEPKGRRLDLALYCSMHALRSFFMLLVRRGWLTRPTRHYITAMSLFAFGTLFYQYDHESDNLHPNIRKALSWITAEKKLEANITRRQALPLTKPPPVEVMADDEVSMYTPAPSTNNLDALSSGSAIGSPGSHRRRTLSEPTQIVFPTEKTV
jgi:hypothetical protein